MKTFEIKAEKRTDLSKQGLREIRERESIPCIVYGGKESLHFSTPKLSLRDLIYTPEVYLVNIELEGANVKCIIQEIQFHPVTDEILHIDFLQVHDDKPVKMSVPVQINGSSEGVKMGGKLMIKARKLSVKALPADLPDRVELNVEKLMIGDSIRVADIDMKGVTFLDSPNNIVVAVRVTRQVVEETPVAAAAPTADSASSESGEDKKED
ncbi:MAG TPA: 50S ribosomal protein L25/general stress protein Ctc [Bacteroidia bacterium]|nr:50S ribosomal protein L25/general stress protein Ctc [Bacteroidia bacterium]HNT79855.1 50S ribosomal protein L25/general stress protein Ctc [Bacteroidia bacterium]